MNKKLSVIIPVSGAKEDLKRCIEAVQNQSYRNIEIILINQGENEKYKNILTEYIDKDERIKYNSDVKAKGNVQAFIMGVKFANGDYVTFLNPSNYVSIDFYRTSIYCAVENNSDIVMGNIVEENKKSEKVMCNLLNVPLKELNNEECFNNFMAQEGLNYSWQFLDNKIYNIETCKKVYNELLKIEEKIIFNNTLIISILLFFYAKKINKIDNDNIFYCYEAKEKTKSLQDEIKSMETTFEFLEELLKKENKLEKYSANIQHWKDLIYQKIINELKKAPDKEKIVNDLNKFNSNYKKVSNEDYFYRVKCGWNNNLEKMKEKICSKDIKCVSFDIFDTLILRPFLYPTDLFNIVDKYFRKITNNKTATDFAKIRVASEKAAREEKEKKNKKEIQDITLDEIYETMEQHYKLSRDIINKLKEFEIEQELRFCTRRNTGFELYQLASELGKKVICTSDMYLSEGVIKKILLKNGYDNIEKVYVSSEYRITKAKGDLYKHVLSDNNLEAKQMVHIGDNYQSDYLNAKKNGINALHLPKATDVFLDTNVTSNLSKMFFRSLPAWKDNANAINFTGIRTMIAINANKYFDNPYRSFNYESDFNADPYLIGYYALGMYMFGLIKWILDDMQDKNYEKMVFMARDGYLPMQCYKLMKRVYKIQPKEEYLYVSRKALIPIIIQDEMDFYKLPETINIEKNSPRRIIKYLKTLINYDEDEIKKACKNKKIDFDDNFENIDEFNKFAEIIVKDFYNKEMQTENLQVLRKYFKNKYGTHSATFDIGYSARPSYYISNLIGEPIDTYFCNINHCEAQRHADMANFKLKTFFDGKPAVTGHAYEMLLSALAPSCTGYKISNGEVSETFEKYENNYTVEFAINTMQNSAIEFVKEIMDTFEEDIDILYTQNYYVSLPFMAYMNSSKEIDKMPFYSVIFEDNCGIGEPLRMVKNWKDDLKAKNQNEMNVLFNMGKSTITIKDYDGLNYNSEVDLNDRNKFVRLLYYILFDRNTLKRRIGEITYKIRHK